jgi:glycosyltransferase involved in cell wall biosynthesis
MMHIKKILSFFYILFFSSFLCAEDKQFVILILSYNNAAYYKKNITSVCAQLYKNYHVIYVDDCSTDGTGDLVAALVEEYGFSDKFTIIRNSENKGAARNHYEIINQCDDSAVIITLDGDDWFATSDALGQINAAYQDPNVWMTYGNYTCFYGGGMYCGEFPREVIMNNTYRKYKWISSHVRTYYAWLFKHIKKEDLMYRGQFFPTCIDQAVMYPLLELAGGRFKFINKLLYVYNNWQVVRYSQEEKRKTGEREVFFVNYIKSLKPYEPLKKIMMHA